MEKPGARCLLEEGINNVVLNWVLLRAWEKDLGTGNLLGDNSKEQNTPWSRMGSTKSKTWVKPMKCIWLSCSPTWTSARGPTEALEERCRMHHRFVSLKEGRLWHKCGDSGFSLIECYSGYYYLHFPHSQTSMQLYLKLNNFSKFLRKFSGRNPEMDYPAYV